MIRRFLSTCGLVAPLLFVFTTVLGGALRPGYSHLSDTISELFSPGSPNKPLLDTLHAIYALLLVLFGIGILQLVRCSTRARRVGMAGASLYITMGLVSMLTATAFPQDPWGSTPTFAGQMHMYLHGVISLLTIVTMILIGIWFQRANGLSWFLIYSLITVGVVIVAAGFYMANQDRPLMGLTERIAGLLGFQWTFVLALLMLSGRLYPGWSSS